MARIMPEPTIALAIPPPTSPGGLGSCVRNAQFRDCTPLISRYKNMAINGKITNTAAAIANNVAQLLVSRRNTLIFTVATLGESGTHPPRRPGYAPYQQSR